MNQPITQLLQESRSGSQSAREKLTPLIYQELKRLARLSFCGENAGHLLQPTALLNEAYEKLIDVDIEWQDREHFYAVAARMMRRILVDEAKKNNALKRGGDAIHTSFEDQKFKVVKSDQALIDLDEVLTLLNQHDSRKANIIELTYFGGLTYEEVAKYLSISSATVHRELRLAEAWLKHKLDA